MAGVPKIFQAMFAAAKKELIGGKKTQMKEILISLTESVIAADFSNLQTKYPQVSMGSYPFEGGTSLVFRSIDYAALDESVSKMIELLERIKTNSIIKVT